MREHLISLATARLDPFSKGRSPASHQLLLCPRRAWVQDVLCPWGGSKAWASLPGSLGMGMLLGATCGGDEAVFCGVVIAKLK